jgi:hypothetical protein
MKYVLAINISCIKYKKYPTIQLFCDDRLIDEFTLDKRYNDTDIEINHPNSKELNLSKITPQSTKIRLRSPILKSYIVDSENLKREICFKLKNADSNHTNGFMTKSTQIYFGLVALIPITFLENNYKNYSKMWDRFVDECTIKNNLDVDSTVLLPNWPIGVFGVIKDNDTNEYSQSQLSSVLGNTSKHYNRDLEMLGTGGNRDIFFKLDSSNFKYSVINNDFNHELKDANNTPWTVYKKDLQKEWWTECEFSNKQSTNTPLISLNSKFLTLANILSNNKYLYENQ